uniref:DRBM domain-containing protein n=1 Tax=Cuerna arida TaxID=1464854 RepID=A0A1B6EP71_9HEMI
MSLDSNDDHFNISTSLKDVNLTNEMHTNIYDNEEEVNSKLNESIMSSDSDIEVVPVIKDIPLIEISDDSDDDIEIKNLMTLFDVSGNSDECYDMKVDRLLNACSLKAEIAKVRKNGAFNESGPFYIDRRFVPVNIYQEGLINNMWNSEIVLKEICRLCRWSMPRYKALHFIPTGGFRCSVWVNGLEFIPKMLARTPASSKEVAAANFLQFLGFQISIENLNLFDDWEHIDKAKLDMRLSDLRADLSAQIRLFKLHTCGYERLGNKRRNPTEFKNSRLLGRQCYKSFKNMNILFHMLRKRFAPLHSKDEHFFMSCSNEPQRINSNRDRFYETDMKHSLTSNTDSFNNNQLSDCNQTFSSLDIIPNNGTFNGKLHDPEQINIYEFDICTKVNKSGLGTINQEKNISTAENMSRSSNVLERHDLRRKLNNKVFGESKSNSSYINLCYEPLQSDSTHPTRVKTEYRRSHHHYGKKRSLIVKQKHIENACDCPISDSLHYHSMLGIRKEEIKMEDISSYTRTARNVSRFDRSRSPIPRAIPEQSFCNIKQEKCIFHTSSNACSESRSGN